MRTRGECRFCASNPVLCSAWHVEDAIKAGESWESVERQRAALGLPRVAPRAPMAPATVEWGTGE